MIITLVCRIVDDVLQDKYKKRKSHHNKRGGLVWSQINLKVWDEQ